MSHDAGPSQNQSILLVEEDPNTAMSIKLVLETNNFKVDMFTDPSMALDKFMKNPKLYSLLVSDMKMVQMSLIEFMHTIKTENPEIKIILITMFEVKPNEFSMMMPSIQVDRFLEKPLLSNKIIPYVNEILNLPGKR